MAATITSRANIELVNQQKGYFGLQQIDGGHPLTDYILSIDSPSGLHFSSTEGDISENRINDIVLAMNLTLTEAALSREGKVLSKPEIVQTDERRQEDDANTVLEKVQQITSENITRSTDETIGISEDHSVVLGRAQQQMDESIVLSNLHLIDKADRHIENHQGNIAKHNLSKALGQYEKAFNQIDRKEIFKDIFNAVEDSINWDRRRDGLDLNKELSAVASIPVNKAEGWRKMYVRLKHPDYRQQLTEYQQTLGQIPNELIPLRLAANKVITERLKNVL